MALASPTSSAVTVGDVTGAAPTTDLGPDLIIDEVNAALAAATPQPGFWVPDADDDPTPFRTNPPTPTPVNRRTVTITASFKKGTIDDSGTETVIASGTANGSNVGRTMALTEGTWPDALIIEGAVFRLTAGTLPPESVLDDRVSDTVATLVDNGVGLDMQAVGSASADGADIVYSLQEAPRMLVGDAVTIVDMADDDFNTPIAAVTAVDTTANTFTIAQVVVGATPAVPAASASGTASFEFNAVAWELVFPGGAFMPGGTLLAWTAASDDDRNAVLGLFSGEWEVRATSATTFDFYDNKAPPTPLG